MKENKITSYSTKSCLKFNTKTTTTTTSGSRTNTLGAIYAIRNRVGGWGRSWYGENGRGTRRWFFAVVDRSVGRGGFKTVRTGVSRVVWNGKYGIRFSGRRGARSLAAIVSVFCGTNFTNERRWVNDARINDDITGTGAGELLEIIRGRQRR